jgi:hypothetical protein
MAVQGNQKVQVEAKALSRGKNGQGIHVPSGGFVRADKKIDRRLIASVDGLEKQGKDHFALTAPGPICIISTDNGLDGVVQKFQEEKEIYIAEYRVTLAATGMKKRTLEDMQELANACDKIWSNIMRDYNDAMESGARTVIVDTATELWEVLRMARFGKLAQVKPHHYAPVNAEFDGFIKDAYGHQGVNLLLLHKLTEEWKDGADGQGRRTGEYKRSGFKGVAFAVQVNAAVWRDPEEKKIPDCFHCTVQDCRHDPSLNGVDLEGLDCNFPVLAAMVLGGDPEEFL